MKQYLSVMVIVLSLLGMSCTKNGHMTRFLQSKLEVKIEPIRIDEDISYGALIQIDRNGDGFVNQLDDGHRVKSKRWKDILDSYLIYLNRYQPYDERYQHYQDMDLNLNHKVERFEEMLCEKQKQGKIHECVVILAQAKEDRNLTDYQCDRAGYALIKYFGQYQKRFQKRRQIAEKYPHSPLRIIEDADFHKLTEDWFDYRFKKNEYHLLVSALLKNHIENKKSFDDGNVLFSPDMLFEKGNGVCGDQSPALALMLKELTGGELNARLYYWKRKHGRMSSIKTKIQSRARMTN